MIPEPRSEFREVGAPVHGGDAAPGVIDFSTGVSPLPPPVEILDAARAADPTRYPHPTALPFRAAAADLHGVAPEQVVAGAGSVELIWALARVFAGAGRTGVVVAPAFGEYERALRASAASVRMVTMAAPRFELDVAMLARALGEDGGRGALVFVCRPSNPCLTTASAADLYELASRWPRSLFVVDEAYQPLFEGGPGLAPTSNLVVLRSLTKLFALPGLRIGYLLATREVARAVQAALPPWNVSSPAQAAGIVAATLAPSHGHAVRARITCLRDAMADALAGVAGPPAQSGGTFLLYDLRRSGAGGRLTHGLLDHGIRVRHCASFGLPEHVRLGVRPEPDQLALVRAWRLLEAPR
jgi:histidinol-phosphate/aromatic aminotransferase/cobyric acid decarboxylase-like protein